MSDTAVCALCNERMPVQDILIHLRVEHDMDVEPATWPDGEYVIVDTTLEPSDFRIPADD